MGSERPFERNGHHAEALPHPGRIQMIANFASNQFSFGRQGIERKRDRKGLLHLQDAIGASHDDSFQFTPVEREAQQAGKLPAFQNF